ncbi:MAG TPA: SDR family NAD(P)-dependent oxidoreductase [Novosphingobium sp.]
MDLKLDGKRALVTGSNTGAGRGIAETLAAEGATVVIHGRKRDRAEAVAQKIAASGGTALVALGDLATVDGCMAVADAVHEQIGGIDILVNNIGGLDASGNDVLTWFQVKPEQWMGSLEQNLLGAVRLVHAFVPAMRERGWGRVINISSGGATLPTQVVPDYNAAKAGINNMTVSLSKALSRSGVTVNTISPGIMHTEMTERMLDQLAPAYGWSDDYDARVSALIDSGFLPITTADLGHPEDLGALVAFLASPLAGFVTGANYRFDGGGSLSVN